MAILAPAYLPRRPTETVLYGIVRENLESFLAHARAHYDGGLPRYVEQELRAYMACGVFSEGFTRCHCDACGHDLPVMNGWDLYEEPLSFDSRHPRRALRCPTLSSRSTCGCRSR